VTDERPQEFAPGMTCYIPGLIIGQWAEDPVGYKIDEAVVREKPEDRPEEPGCVWLAFGESPEWKTVAYHHSIVFPTERAALAWLSGEISTRMKQLASALVRIAREAGELPPATTTESPDAR
jgi:hypothetical protein